MAEQMHALIRDDVVVNLIVTDDSTPDGWLEEYVEAEGLDRAVDLADVVHPVAIGFVYRQGRGYVPPEELTAEPAHLPADGTTASTLTYVDNRADPPDSVTADVNGLAQTVPLVGGRGTLQVASRTAGDAVTVRVGGAVAIVTVDG
jgi:hypothetical protein